MIIRIRPHLVTLILVLCFAGISTAQKPSATPRQERLLNGLKILVLNTPAAEKVRLRLRIHSGAAFDPQEKEGVMKLLSESFFPNAETRAFFSEELGGSLEIECNYDFIQINAEAKSSEFLTLLETVAQAISNPDLSKDATASLKAALSEEIQKAEKDPAYVADRAVAKKLFGSFPYGRPVIGTAASLQKLDFADLKFSRDRLLTADNATLAIHGNVDPAQVFRAARRYFGSWLKSDKSVPSTFRQPDAPDAAVVTVQLPGLANSEVRYAARGFARSSKEFAAAEIYERVLQARFDAYVSKGLGSEARVTHEEHVLPGSFVFRYRSQPTSPQLLPPANSGNVAGTGSHVHAIIGLPVTEGEFSSARAEVLNKLGTRDPVDLWLDVDTFRIASVPGELNAFQNVTLADVNAFSARFAREPVAAAVVTAAPLSPAN